MVRIKLFLDATFLITQYFTLNITTLHAAFVCIKWKRGFYDLQLVPIKTLQSFPVKFRVINKSFETKLD